MAVIVKHGTWGYFAGGVPGWLCPGLAQRGYASLGINTRSSMHAWETSLFEDIIDDLGAWMNFLEGRGFKKVVMGGHSLGSSEVPYYVGKTRDTRIKAILLYGAHHDIKGIQWEKWYAVDPKNPHDAYEKFCEKCRKLVREDKGDTLLIMPFHGPYTARLTDDAPPNWNVKQRWTGVTAKTFLSYMSPESDSSTIKWIPHMNKDIKILTVVHNIVNTAARPIFSKEIQKVAKESGLSCDYVDINADHYYIGHEEEAITITAEWLKKIGLVP